MALLESYIAEPPPLYETEQGAVRVRGTRVSLDTVIHAYNGGATPEDIVRSFTTLTLRDVYAVITYYFGPQGRGRSLCSPAGRRSGSSTEPIYGALSAGTGPSGEAGGAARCQTNKRSIDMRPETVLSKRSHETTLRFLAEPTDMNFGGKVHGGAVMKWIDQAGYACAVGWSGHYCVTLYVGGIRFL